MKSVFRYELLQIDGISSLALPVGAEILRVDVQGSREDPALWALVEIGEKEFEQRVIRIAGTGHLIEERIIRYINTFCTHNRVLWWYAFEVEG